MNRVQPAQMHGRVQLGLAIALLMLGALGVAGCGVRGPLETPKDAANETGNATPGTPGKPVAHKPSVLDPLIR
jgi:predicted small lipoprotein YifL